MWVDRSFTLHRKRGVAVMTNPAETHFLKRLVLHHSAYLKQLNVELLRFPSERHGSPDFQFLALVLQYHEASNARLPDWMGLYRGFTAFGASDHSMDDLLSFFVLNYRFLTLRNSKSQHRMNELLDLAYEAAGQAREFDEPISNLLSGFINFNIARFFAESNPADAITHMIEAAKSRVDWYRHMCDVREDFLVVAAAAEQVRKLPGAFQRMFPKEDMSQLGISNELMAEVTAIAPGDREVK